MPINPADRLLSDDDLRGMFFNPARIPQRSAPAFMYDEDMDQESIGPLRETLRLYITTVQEQGLQGEKSDYRILAHARSIGCTLITRDKMFKSLHDHLDDIGCSHAGIIFVPFSRTPDDVIAFVTDLMERVEEKDAPDILFYNYWRI
jgi:hypothetical protein